MKDFAYLFDEAKDIQQPVMSLNRTVFEKMDHRLWPLYWIKTSDLFRIPIRESQEEIVSLPKLVEKKGSGITFAAGSAAYGAQSNDMELRREAAERLLKAESFLREQYGNQLTFKITDALRPL